MADQAQLIASLIVKLDAFEQQMKKAGVIADNAVKDIEGKFAKANPVFSGTFLGTFLGRLSSSAVKDVFKFIEELPQKFRDLAEAADVAGISIERAFALGHITGNMEATEKALTNIATMLDRAKRGEENSLAKLFSVNDIDVKNIKDAGEAFEKIIAL